MANSTAPIRTPLKVEQNLLYFSTSSPWVRWFHDVEETSIQVNRTQHVVSTVQFDKTDATLATVPGLTVNLEEGTYHFDVFLHTMLDLWGGLLVSMAGTAGASNTIYQVMAVDNLTGTYGVCGRVTELSGAGVGSFGADSVWVEIDGTVTITTPGTLEVRFAQCPIGPAGTSSVLQGSYMMVQEV